jgi:hypothetical protein
MYDAPLMQIVKRTQQLDEWPMSYGLRQFFFR